MNNIMFYLRYNSRISWFLLLLFFLYAWVIGMRRITPEHTECSKFYEQRNLFTRDTVAKKLSTNWQDED
jgi:hypothetical protein